MNRLFATIAFFTLTVNAFSQRITVSGYVKDSRSGETLIAAEVLSGRDGVVADNDGRYAISLSAGETTLHYYYTGYHSQTVTCILQRDTVINIGLEQSEALTASRIVAVSETGSHSTLMGAMKIPADALQKAPVILGEQDVLKTIQLLPGIQSGMDGFSSFFVRGGGVDENMFLLDGVPLYNVSHMLGLFSAFTPESVKNATVYKGAFPARYGGRVSGIVDIRTNEGDQYKIHGAAGVGLLSSKLHIEGPIVKGKTTFSLSGRLMHTGLFAPVLKLAKVGLNYNFYDMTAKFTHRFSDNDKLSLSAFAGRDHFIYNRKGENEKINWGNIMAALRWHHVFDGKWSLSTQAAFNSFGSHAEYGSSNDNYIYNSAYKSLIRDFSLTSDLDGKITNRQHVQAGMSVISHFFSPSTHYVMNENNGEKKVLADLSSEPHYNGWEASVYAQDEITVLPGFTILPGIRYVLMTSSGSAHHSIQPRLTARFGFKSGLSFKAGYARMGQYVHQLASSNITLPSDIWVPITSKIKPVISDIGSLGAYYDGMSGWDFSVEAYIKYSQNVLDYRDGASMFGSVSGWENLVEMGISRSFGIELYAERTIGPVTGWIAYTLSKTERRFPSGYINSGNWYPSKYDRRHVFNLYADWTISRNLDISATWSIMSGGWLSLPERTIAYLNVSQNKIDALRNHLGVAAQVTYYYPSRNNYHLPPSHTLNISVNLRKPVKHGVNFWSFSIYNLYNALNPNMVFMSLEQYSGNNDNKPIVVKKVTFLPVIPSFSYTFKF